MWALGDYPAVARDIVGDLGPVLVQASGVGPGERVLDVAAGSGNASIPAAAAGATVVASDLTPELFETGRKAAAEAGVEIDWQQGDAEALPYPDASFDTVLSCLGVMFAPHHQAGADELVRVLRPGGTLGLLELDAGGLHRADVRHHEAVRAGAPARGAAPAAVGQRGARPRPCSATASPRSRRREASLVVDEFATPAEFRDYFKANYGPTIAVYRAIADEQEKVAALDRELEELGRRFDRGAAGSSVLDWEYLLLTCERS